MSRRVVCQPAFSDAVYYGRLIKSDRTVRVLKDVRVYEGPQDEDGATAFRLSVIGPAPGTVSRPCERVEITVSNGDIVFSVSADAMLKWEPSPIADPAPKSYGIRLLDAGPNKIAVIKAIRAIAGLGLKEAKDIAEMTPSKVTSRQYFCDAKAVIQALSAAGATSEHYPETE